MCRSVSEVLQTQSCRQPPRCWPLRSRRPKRSRPPSPSSVRSSASLPAQPANTTDYLLTARHRFIHTWWQSARSQLRSGALFFPVKLVENLRDSADNTPSNPCYSISIQWIYFINKISKGNQSKQSTEQQRTVQYKHDCT